MTLTRYTFEGEGIFRAMNRFLNEVDMSVGDEQDFCDAADTFEMRLEVPNVCTQKGRGTKSYFTDDGISEFAEELDTIEYYMDRYRLGRVKIERIEYGGEALYRDRFQVVLAA